MDNVIFMGEMRKMSPSRSLRPCAHPACAALVQVGQRYCPAHAPAHKQDYARRHPEYQELYNNQRWRDYRKMFLAEHPLCVNFAECKQPADTVDHKEPHHGEWDKFWNPANHQSMCSQCHNKKTAKESGWGKGEEI